MYKVYSKVASDIMNDIFEKKNKILYKLRSNCHCIPRNIKFVDHGPETISYLALKIWNLVPRNVKDSENMINAKANVTFWKEENSPCQSYKV